MGPWVHGKMNFTTGGPVSAARYSKIARALWKATLSCMYLDHGEMIFESRFDEIREIVIGSRPASGFVTFPKQTGPPNTEVFADLPVPRHRARSGAGVAHQDRGHPDLRGAPDPQVPRT